jgi:hypothetical protein
MDVDGQESRESGGFNDEHIFFMKYPLSFLKYWYIYVPISNESSTGGERPIPLPQNH